MTYGPQSGLLPDTDPVAVIDIGSNSVRLVVYERAARSPTPLYNEKVLCGLGRELATTGRLGEAAIDRALRTLRRFRALADQLGCARIEVVATAAAREAENGAAFVAEAERACGMAIDVLSGRREADLVAAGVMAGLHEADGLAADLGGGSLEIIDLKGQEVTDRATLPLGALRLLDYARGDRVRARAFIEEQLDKVDWLGQGRGRSVYAVGGTWRAFARLHMAQTEYPLSVMHCYRMETNEALTFANVLDRQSPMSLEGIKAVSKSRRETLPMGALILERLLKRARPREVVVSAFGLREGLLFSMLPAEERARDPLIAACEDLARLRSRSLAHARELVAWTEPLFRAPGTEETPAERRLRAAACLVSDIGWRGHPDYRGEQSLNLIAHGAFAGLDHPGRAFLALTVYHRHNGPIEDGAGPALRQLVDDRALQFARIIGAAIRAAHMLSAAMPGVLPHVPVTYEGAKLVLEVPGRFAALEGERLERRFAALAKLLGREPEIRIGTDRQRMAV